MKRHEDPFRDPASEARDDWADANGFTFRATTYGTVVRHESFLADDVEGPDPNNLEGPGPTDEERRVNAAAISKLTVQERFDLMFRGPSPESP
jgi:hypothetical protein